MEPGPMNWMRPSISFGHLAFGGLLLCAGLALDGCHQTPAADAAVAAEAKDKANAANAPDAAEAADGVSLKPEQIQTMGIVTAAARPILHSPEAAGYAVVIAHEGIAAALAELETAAATERQSRAALERMQRLSGTAGAMPADTLEGLERQAAVDRVALELSHRRLSALVGQNSPWRDPGDNAQLRALAAGDAKLVRVSFPLGSIGDIPPESLRLAHIDESQRGKRVDSRSVWRAPADANVPGRSFFAYLKSSEFGEGEHLLAWVPVGKGEAGVLVPDSAAVINAGKYWCYVEQKPGQFVRAELDPNAAVTGGYFVKDGIAAGAQIVTVAAGQLLAREINPTTAAAE